MTSQNAGKPAPKWVRLAYLPARGKRVSCRLYRCWTDMRARCRDKNHHAYSRYGGAGVTVCDEWHDYAIFRAWAIANGYGKDLTIDRIDPEGPYSPDNCRWLSKTEQVYTSRQTRQLTFRGETKPGPVWAKELGLPVNLVRDRLKRGWSVEKTLTTPRKERFAQHQKRSITDDQVRWARTCGLPTRVIAERLGLKSIPYVRRIIVGAVYGDVS